MDDLKEFRIKVQYSYSVNEWYTNKNYIVDNGWNGFCKVVQNLPQLQNHRCDIPCVLTVRRYIWVDHPDREIMGVPLKNWAYVAGFKEEERFKYNIIVPSDGKIPTLGTLKEACPWRLGCHKCIHKDCKDADKNTPAYYSNYVRVGPVPLDAERHICIAKDDCRLLWPQSHSVNPIGISQALRDFFEQPDAIQIYIKHQDRLMTIRVQSCALREKE